MLHIYFLVVCFPALNAVLRRIDLGCKLLAPLFVGLLMSVQLHSPRTDTLDSTGGVLFGAIFIALWNVASVFLEYVMLAHVYASFPQLKGIPRDSNPAATTPDNPATNGNGTSVAHRIARSVRQSVSDALSSVRVYRRQSVFRAGLSLSCVYLTVLSFGNETLEQERDTHLVCVCVSLWCIFVVYLCGVYVWCIFVVCMCVCVCVCVCVLLLSLPNPICHFFFTSLFSLTRHFLYLFLHT